jgi:hypothetical protein
MKLRNWIHIPLILASVAAGFVLAFVYKGLDPVTRDKIPLVERSVNAVSDQVVARFVKNDKFDDSLWRAFEGILPAEVLKNRESYQLHVLQSPFELRSGETHWPVFDFCNDIPESTPNYQKTLLTVPDGYQAFLDSLEPIVPQLATGDDRRKLQDLYRKLTSASKGRPGHDDQGQAQEIRKEIEAVDSILQKYRSAAAKKGLSSVGGADYYDAFWNDGYQEGRPGSASRVKRCEAPGLEDWLSSGQGRPTIIAGTTELKTKDVNSTSAVGESSAKSWTYVDIGNAHIFDSSLKPTGQSSDSKEPLQATLQARRLQIFWLKRAAWFNSESIKLYGKKGPWASGRPVRNPYQDLWGPQGVLRSLPVALLVVDSPAAALRLRSDDYNRIVEWSNDRHGDAPLQVGMVNFHRADSGFTLKFDGAEREIRILPNQQSAYVVAVLTLKMPLISSYD